MKYRETKVVNYRQEDDDSNILSTGTFLDCDEYMSCSHESGGDQSETEHLTGGCFKLL